MIGSLDQAPEAAVQAALAQATGKTAARDLAREGTLVQLGVLTAFWIYVTVSNLLYAHNMSLSLDPGGRQHLFAAWPARSLQHLLRGGGRKRRTPRAATWRLLLSKQPKHHSSSI